MHKTRCFVLSRHEAGEFDCWYVAYTLDFGKKRLFVKGAKRIKSKIAGHLFEFAETEIDFINGRNSEKITGAFMVQNFVGIKNDLRKIVLGNFVLELVEQMIKWDHPDGQIYRLINDIFSVISREENLKKCYFSINVFIWKFFVLLGYRPDFEKCVLCRGAFTEKIYFDARRTGFLCSRCFENTGHAILINAEILKYLKGEGGIIKAGDTDEAIYVIRNFMFAHLDKGLRSAVWMDKLYN